LAKEALVEKEKSSTLAKSAKEEANQFESSVHQLETNVAEIKKSINKWQNELKTLKARVKVSNATQKLNKQMADIDAFSTVSMLERMKDKVTQEEALAEAYGESTNANFSLDAKIDKAIDFTQDKANNELLKLKEKLGFTND